MNKVKYEVIKDIATLSTNDGGYSKKLTFMKWGSYEPCYDLRTWKDDKPLKGITLTKEELQTLLETLKEL